MDLNSVFNLPSYDLGVINILLLFLFLILLFIYKYIYPYKNINWGLVILILSMFPIISIFRNTDYSKYLYQDSAYAAAMWNSISEGHFPPVWTENMDTLYGYPVFLFLYPLPFYLTTIFHLIGFNFVNSVKLVYIFSYLIAGIGMWKLTSSIFNFKTAFMSTILYQFSPYRFIDMHFRLGIGESLAFTFIPLIFYYSQQNVIAGGLFIGLLILSHPVIALTSLTVMLVYYQRKSISSLMFGLGLTCYYWLPILIESRFVHKANELIVSGISFVNTFDLLYSPYRMGFLFQGNKGELAFILGYGSIVVMIISTFIFIVRKKSKIFYFWYFITLFFIFLMHEQSILLWKVIPLIENFQFSWRLLSIISFTIALLAGYMLKLLPRHYHNNIIIIVSCLTIITSILNWGNRESNPGVMSDEYIQKRLPNSGERFEYGFIPPAIPIWVNLNDSRQNKSDVSKIDVIEGYANITQIERTSTFHKYLITVIKDTYFRENTNYYPGWKLHVNGVEQEVYYTNPEFPGPMEFFLKPGIYSVVFKYIKPDDQLVSIFISLIFLMLLCIYFLKSSKILIKNWLSNLS